MEPRPGSKERLSFASAAGMRAEALRACIDSREIRRSIEDDPRAAIRLGFDDPPAFIAQGVPLSGMQSAEASQEALAGYVDSLQ